jgi:type III pantothenate kinase
MDTIILLDVGNTNVKIGLARPAQGLVATYALPTSASGGVDTPDAWGLRLLDICRVEGITPGQVLDITAASVVPPMNPVLARAAERFFHRPLRLVPEDIPLPIENRYARPQEVGADRLVTASAARALSRARSIIVVDFGTATTFDCVQDNAYLGGLICPGVLSSARALATGTAKLPQITLEIDGSALHIGRSTAESLNQGLIHGFAAMVEGLFARLAASLGEQPEDVDLMATGGFAARIAEVCPAIRQVREDLLMEGLLRAAGTLHG